MDCLEQGLNDGLLRGSRIQTKSYSATVLYEVPCITVLLLFFPVQLGPEGGQQLLVVKTFPQQVLK
jgi:hypothetical protein